MIVSEVIRQRNVFRQNDSDPNIMLP